MCVTLRFVSDGDEVRNENSGPVEGNFFQVGAWQGDVTVPADAPADESLAQDLASVVGVRSRDEDEHWQVADPEPLQVRWHATETDLLDQCEDIQRSPERHDPVPLSGQFTEIRNTFQSTGSRRLVILGRAGAGKTVLAHRLIRDLLKHRNQHGPVPALFSLSDWNPTAIRFREWMIDRLVRDHPFLEQHDATGKRGAAVLVDRDWILPVLDGFDELPSQHRIEAIRQISRVRLPLVLTSRPDEYAHAAREAKAVGRAAAIEIEDLTLEQAQQYLCRSAKRSRAAEWKTVFHQLHSAPEQATSRNLIRVLTTPLMVMLARTLYNEIDGRPPDEHRPGELLDTTRFPTGNHLERHLLSGYVDTVYDLRRAVHPPGTTRPIWGEDQARHWLGYLATRLRQRGTHDFTWWQLTALLSRRIRIPATIAITGLVAGLICGLLADRPAYGLTGALAGGIVVGFLNESNFVRGRAGHEPERLRPYRRRRGRQPRHSKHEYITRAAAEFSNGLAVGLVFGIAFGIAFGIMDEVAGGFAAGLGAGFGTGVLVGVANVAVSILGEPHDPHDGASWRLLSTDRTITLIRMITTAVVVIPIGFLVYADDPVLGLEVGSALGLLVALLRLGLSAWGNWLLFARVLLPLTGRLSWRPRRFLEDAYDRGILRQAGVAYQFRHAQLRDHLADQHLNNHDKR